MRFTLTHLLFALSCTGVTNAFTGPSFRLNPTSARCTGLTFRYMSEEGKESAFIPLEQKEENDDEIDDDDVEIPLEAVETLGRGAAKVSETVNLAVCLHSSRTES